MAEQPAGVGKAVGDGLPAERPADAPVPGAGTPGGELVPRWLVDLAELGWRVLAVAGLLVVIWFAVTLMWTVTASIAVAVVVSAVFAPLVLRLRAQGRSRTGAAGIVWLTAILTVGGILLVLVLAFLPYLADLVRSLEMGLDTLQSRLADLSIPAWAETLARDAVGAVRSSAADTGGSIVAAAAEVVTILILATFLVFFFLRDGDKAWLWAFQAVGAEKRERITSAGDDALTRVGGYLRGTTALAGIIAVTDYLFMLLLGVPLALPLAVLAFLTGYIPYFGGIVATGLILLVSLAALGPGPTLLLLLLMGVRGALLGYFVRPVIYGRTVSIHPARGPHRAAGRLRAGGHRGPLRGGAGHGHRLRGGGSDRGHHRSRAASTAAQHGAGLAGPAGAGELAPSRLCRARDAAGGRGHDAAARGHPGHPGLHPGGHARPARDGAAASRSLPRAGSRHRRGRRLPGRGHHPHPGRGVAGGPGRRDGLDGVVGRGDRQRGHGRSPGSACGRRRRWPPRGGPDHRGPGRGLRGGDHHHAPRDPAVVLPPARRRATLGPARGAAAARRCLATSMPPARAPSTCSAAT